MEMLFSLKDDKEVKPTETLWRENGFFKDQGTDLTITKANFPETTLVYINSSTVSAVKGGYEIYLDYVILAHILPVVNPSADIDLGNHKYQDNEVLLYVPLYNTENGLYRGLDKKFVNIILRGDINETLYSYDHNKEKSKILYCLNKQPLPNIFQCTAFKKHMSYLLDQKKLQFSKMFMFLSSTLDQKEELNQYSNNVNLHPIDVSYDKLKVYNNHEDFNPADLDNSSERNKIKKIFYSFMKEATDASNHNLIRNSNAFLSKGGKIVPEFEFSWVNDAFAESQQKYQLGY